MTEKTEALRLADWHKAMADEPKRNEAKRDKHRRTEAELRRLSIENDALGLHLSERMKDLARVEAQRDLLLEALKYHQEQTRPIQRTLDVIKAVEDQRCRAEPRSDGDFVCDCKIGECPGRSAALAQQAEPFTTAEIVRMNEAWLHRRAVGLNEQAEPVEGNTLLRDFLAAAKEAGVTHIRQVEAALRAALAQHPDTDCHTQGICQRSGYGITQQAEPVHEPVAWVECNGDLVWNNRAAAIGRNLYTAPPQRKPLDDLAIADIYTKWDATPGVSMADFARAVERAHGIGRQTDPQIEDRLARHGIPKP